MLFNYEVYHQKNVNRTQESFHDISSWSPSDWMLAVTGELGELAHTLKKVKKGDYSFGEKKEQIADEIGDIFAYLDLLCTRLNIDLPKAIVNKFNKVSDRIGSDIKINIDIVHTKQ